MSWHYLPELVGVSSEQPSLNGDQSVPWKSSRSAAKSLCGVKGTVCFHCSQSGTTSKPLMEDPGVDWWMSSLGDSPANRGASQEESEEALTTVTSGLIPQELSVKSDQHSRYLKTFQDFSNDGLRVTSEESSVTFPRAGTMRSGIAYLLLPLVPRISGKEYSYWPTPDASAANLGEGLESWLARRELMRAKHSNGNGFGMRLTQWVKLWPTPQARDWKDTGDMDYERQKKKSILSGAVGGELNPTWVEWLMGWPIGWTDFAPLGTGKFLQWLSSHGKVSQKGC